MKALAGVLAFLAFSAFPAGYRVDLKGGVTYWSSAKPVLRSGIYVFRASDGTLVSIRKSEVVSVRQAPAPPRADESIVIGSATPAAAARNQKVVASQLREERQRKGNPLFRQDPYRPGVGLSYPPSANDYVVGKTFAYPPSGTVYEGPAPTNVPEGPAPKAQAPEPPPPPRFR